MVIRKKVEIVLFVSIIAIMEHTKKAKTVIALLIALLLCSCSSVSQTEAESENGFYCFMVPPFTQEELEERSTYIIDALITSKQGTLNGKAFDGYPMPYTEYCFEVIEQYKGDATGLSSAYFCGDTTTDERSSYNDERLIVGEKYKLYLEDKGDYVVSTIPSTFKKLD